ncbi:MAG: hypothetical protein GY777_08955 [Candidatus Brocadiaceae bacterium]|nr:hypothetical protein [Candidatus Brocadiaceae bacterium]
MKSYLKRKKNCQKKTCSLCLCNASKEDGDEPFQRVLVHGVNVGHVSHAEEQNLSVDSHGYVLGSGLVNVFFSLLSHLHLGLLIKREKMA